MHKGRKNRTVASYSSRLAWKKIFIQIYNLAMALVFKLKRVNYYTLLFVQEMYLFPSMLSIST